MFVPQLIRSLKGYSRRQLTSDLTAGVVVGIVALPLAMAFAIASGLSPERGLYTAVVAGFLISALGGSRVQIGGPTGAFVVVVFGIVQHHGVGGLTICTIMAGLILVGLGLLRLGGIIKYIPYPVIIGFTSGIALIIFSSEIKDLLGLTTGPLPGEFLGKWAEYLRSLNTISWSALAISALSIALIVCWPRTWKKVPGSVAAMIAATVLVQVLGLHVETIGSRFGTLPSRLPPLSLPAVSLAQVRELLGPALTVALLAGIESLLSAVVADGMTGLRHEPNMELVAQGVANVVGPLFGGFPATGAIARTATNIRNGGTTPVAGMIHALTLLAVLLLFGRWASLVPMCCLASILVVVAYNMSEWRVFRALMHAPRSDVLVLVTTFVITVIFDLTLAVQIGVVLAVFLFMKRMANATRVRSITIELADPKHDWDADVDGEVQRASKRQVPAGVEVFEVHGPFFFGAADKVREAVQIAPDPPRVLILRMQHMPVIDATGLHALAEIRHGCAKSGIVLVLCGLGSQPYQALRQSGQLEAIGKENLTQTIDQALNRARSIFGLPPEPLQVGSSEPESQPARAA
jgi:SulP family sulfate permease